MVYLFKLFTHFEMFNRKKLTEDELMLIRLRIEDVEYTCGGQLFSEDDDAQLVYVEVKV